MAFELRALPFPSKTDAGLWFIFYQDKLLVEAHKDVFQIPALNKSLDLHMIPENSLYLGRLDNIPCFTGDLSSDIYDCKNLVLVGLRQLFGLISDELFWLAAKAYHLVNWDRNSRFCGKCGCNTDYKPTEHSKFCTNCGLSFYPKISPAVIVAVTKQNKLLLAKNAFYKNKFYSVLAGFVEPGETLEACVAREIKEEAGIEVKNVTYFGSQPWPFPDSLMVAFTAEYAGGELVIDKEELCEADWFKADELPEIPGKMSIARKLIDWFVARELNATL